MSDHQSRLRLARLDEAETIDGFRLLEGTEVSLPDGVTLACAAMEKPIAGTTSSGHDGP